MFDLFGLEKPHKISDGDDVSHLTTVYDVAILGIVRGLLEEENIPYLVRDRGVGQVTRLVTGMSGYGMDIYVPTSALETAHGLIAGLEDEPVIFVDDDGNEISVEEAAGLVFEATDGTDEDEDGVRDPGDAADAADAAGTQDEE